MVLLCVQTARGIIQETSVNLLLYGASLQNSERRLHSSSLHTQTHPDGCVFTHTGRWRRFVVGVKTQSGGKETVAEGLVEETLAVRVVGCSLSSKILILPVKWGHSAFWLVLTTSEACLRAKTWFWGLGWA